MVHMIDRQSMVDTLKYGLSAVADIPLLPEDPVYRLAQQRGLPTYPYDVARAHRLLAEAGLTRGPDGIFRSQGGEPFTVQVAATADIASQVQELQVIADQWKTAGLDATSLPIPDVAPDKNEIRARARGIVVKGLKLDYTSFREFITSESASESTRWRGDNIGAYSNAAYDQGVNRLLTTIRSSDREQVGADLVRLSLEELVWIPLFYGASVVAVRKGVRGVTRVLPAQDVVAWNAHLWELQ
jgi:ABC-type transport system substrate-binding protein